MTRDRAIGWSPNGRAACALGQAPGKMTSHLPPWVGTAPYRIPGAKESGCLISLTPQPGGPEGILLVSRIGDTGSFPQ